MECMRKAIEEQSKAGEMRGRKRRMCSVLPLLQSSQNCSADYIRRRVTLSNRGDKGMWMKKDYRLLVSLVELFWMT